MAGLEVNSVNAAQGANGAKELKPQEEQKIGTVPVGQGYGAASGGGQSEDVKLTNTYGKDFANFANFKGNDKNDAMRITTSAYNTVKKQYMQLQHEYPDVVVNFEPMPDPQKCGKKREGFFNYQQQLDVWKDTALQQINDAREKTTVEVVGEGVGAVNRNTNVRAAENMAVTVGAAEAVMENDNKNTAMLSDQLEDLSKQLADGTAQIINQVKTSEGHIKQTVRNAAGQICTLIKDSTGKILSGQQQIVQDIGDFRAATKKNFNTLNKRNENRTGRIIGNQDRNATQTQELEGIGQKISTNIAGSGKAHTSTTINRVNNMRNKILQSGADYNTRKELLTHLAAFSTQMYMNDAELAAEEARIEGRLNAR